MHFMNKDEIESRLAIINKASLSSLIDIFPHKEKIGKNMVISLYGCEPISHNIKYKLSNFTTIDNYMDKIGNKAMHNVADLCEKVIQKRSLDETYKIVILSPLNMTPYISNTLYDPTSGISLRCTYGVNFEDAAEESINYSIEISFSKISINRIKII